MSVERVERTCDSCGAAYAFDPESFAGQRPPRLCRSCNFERRSRLEETQGVVAQVGPVAAVLRDGRGGMFFWTWSAARTEAPQLGERLRFVFDPLEQPAPGRHRIARNVRPLEE